MDALTKTIRANARSSETPHGFHVLRNVLGDDERAEKSRL